MSEVLMRQIEMLRMIPRRRTVTTKKLKERLDTRGYYTTERTIQRDLIEMSRKLPIVCKDDEKPYQWSWAIHGELWDIPQMDVDECLPATLLEIEMLSSLESTMDNRFAAIQPYLERSFLFLLNKIGSASFNHWKRKIRSIDTRQIARSYLFEKSVLDPIHLGIIEKKYIEISTKDNPELNLEIEVLALLAIDTVYKMIYKRSGSDQIEFLSVANLLKASLSETFITLPTNLDLDEYINKQIYRVDSPKEKSKLILHFYNYAGDFLNDSALLQEKTYPDPYHQFPDFPVKQKVQDLGNGELRVTAIKYVTKRTIQWILGLGPDVVVIEPEWLRNEIKALATKTASQYS